MPTRPAHHPLMAALSLLVLAAGCGGGGGGAAPSATTPPVVASCPIAAVPATPSWSAHVYPFIQQSCGTQSTSCHDNPGTRINLNQSAPALYAALVDKPAAALPGWYYIKSGDDLTDANRRSWLYEKVDPLVPGQPGQAATGAATGTQMPAGSSLCRPTIDTLKAWIIAGAANN